MPKPRKRHNPHQRARDFFNSRTRVWTWEADRSPNDDQILYAQKHMGTFWRDLAPDVLRRVLTVPHNWSVCVRALCWTGQGEHWVEDVTLIVRDTPLQALEGVYLRYRQEVLDAVQRRHVYDLGWLAQTYDRRNPADDPQWPLTHKGDLTLERQNIWQRVNQAQTNVEATNGLV